LVWGAPMDRFYECFGEIADPRAENCQHDLLEILFIALLASLCGGKSCSDMAEFGRAKEPLLRSILSLRHGIPSHDTFSRIFRLLDPRGFETAFRRFMAAFGQAAKIAKPKGVVAVDGKALRRAYERGRSYMPRVMVTAWGAQTRMTLASLLAAQGNEAAAALQLIELLQLKSCTVTADALHCHRAMAAAITARGGDYVLAVKGNQPALLRDAEAALAAAPATQPACTTERAHDREETRIAIVAPAAAMARDHDFPGLVAVARIDSRRGAHEPVQRMFLLSKRWSADRLLEIVRAHWGIENRLHWTLDVTLDEDLARNRKDHAPENLAILRRMALNIATAHPDTKTSLRRKLLRAGWHEAFLFDLIRHMR
jgi:predicted transposase YbfD/YdcC